jgi:uncharacterized circularly permuted ATP-grasp superfamily protein
VREHYRTYDGWLASQPADVMRSRRDEAEMIFRRVGITFAVYGAKDEDGAGTERLIPFDLIPRVIPRTSGADGSRPAPARDGAEPLHPRRLPRPGDPQGRHRARRAGEHNAQFRPEMMGVDVPAASTRTSPASTSCAPPEADGSGEYYVLEDNLRVPSGVSYMLENRKMMMRLFPELFSMHRVAPVAHYPDLLLETLRAVAPAGGNDPPSWC